MLRDAGPMFGPMFWGGLLKLPTASGFGLKYLKEGMKRQVGIVDASTEYRLRSLAHAHKRAQTGAYRAQQVVSITWA